MVTNPSITPFRDGTILYVQVSRIFTLATKILRYIITSCLLTGFSSSSSFRFRAYKYIYIYIPTSPCHDDSFSFPTSMTIPKPRHSSNKNKNTNTHALEVFYSTPISAVQKDDYQMALYAPIGFSNLHLSLMHRPEWCWEAKRWLEKTSGSWIHPSGAKTGSPLTTTSSAPHGHEDATAGTHEGDDEDDDDLTLHRCLTREYDEGLKEHQQQQVQPEPSPPRRYSAFYSIRMTTSSTTTTSSPSRDKKPKTGTRRRSFFLVTRKTT